MWRQMDVRLDDTDRIEVISGPGGPRWGANAVNGVITIVRKSWANTQGIEVDAPSSAPVRYIPRTVLVHLRLSF